MCIELAPFFVSHSGKDKVILDGVIEAFDFYNKTQAYTPHNKRHYIIMNEERLKASQEPYWQQIKNQIERSDALILIISEGITQKEFTQNWVAFEVGVAAGCNPPKPVIAIQGQAVRVPIPYVTHYFSYSNTLPPSNVKKPESWRGQFNILIYTLFANTEYKPEQPIIHCPMCNSKYHYHGPELIIKCPCCPCIIQKKLTPDAERELTYEKWCADGKR
jgi:hypothetical protein